VKYLVTAAFLGLFTLTAPLCVASAALLWLVTAPFDPERHAVHWWVCHWCFQYMRLSPGWHIRFEGRENIPPGPSVLIANHQSAADIGVCFGLYRPFKFVSKASLFSVPLVGWSMRLAGYVELVRGRRQSTLDMLATCRTRLRAGTPVLIYPEGTYSPPGGLLPFKRGAFRLAIEEKVPLVPIVIEGTRELLDGDGPWFSPRCEVKVRVLPALLPSQWGPDDRALADRARALYARELRLAAPTP